MSVRTTADENLEKARTSLTTVVTALNEILILECWGHDSYTPEFIEKMQKAYHLTIDAKRLLNH